MKRLGQEGSDRLNGDERILGDTEFVLQILKQASERLDRRYEPASRGWNKTKVAGRVADITISQRKRYFGRVRNAISSKRGGCFAIGAGRSLGSG